MTQKFLRCNENDWIISNEKESVIESPPLIKSRAILYNGRVASGMLHISNDIGLNKLDDFINKIKSDTSNIDPSNFKIAMKTINVDYETDRYLIEISKKLETPIEEICNLIIPMDFKKIITMKINKEKEIIEMF